MKGYKAEVREASKELTPKERIALKDTSNAVKLDEATAQGKVVITPELFAVINVHNEEAQGEDKDYEQYVIVDKDGTKYTTGSSAFWSSFMDIVDEMGDEPFSIEAYRKDSKNYAGKQFITCSIVID